MYQDEIKKASLEQRETLKLLDEAGENDEIKEIVTKLYYKPAQTLNERYEYVKKSREEGSFEFFKKIAEFLGERYKYYVKDRADEYECCVYYGSDAYDFSFIHSLARFYQNNSTLFDGHFDIIKRLCTPDSTHCISFNWEKAQEFWLKHTIESELY